MRAQSEASTILQAGRFQRIALGVGVAAAALSTAGYFISGASLFFQAYLTAFLFWLSISLGLLAVLLLHFLVGTHWGMTIRRVAEAGAGSLWAMGLLFLPLLAGMGELYPWTRPEVVQASEMLQAKTFYLNTPFFIGRAVLYFVVWILLGYFANRLSAGLGARNVDQDALKGKLRAIGAGGLILYVLTMTFATIDWLMSLQPLWSSTIFGLLVIVGQLLTALSFALAMLNLFPGLSLGRRWEYTSTPVPYKDLGALMLTFVIGWAYLAYFQYLIIWAGDIPREVVWFVDRVSGGWNVLILIIALFQFAIPFLALISMRVRHNLRALGGLGAVLLLTYLVNIFWHVKPAFSPGQFSLSWLDLVLPVAIGGLWLAAFLGALQKRPALTPVEQEALALKEARQVG